MLQKKKLSRALRRVTFGARYISTARTILMWFCIDPPQRRAGCWQFLNKPQMYARAKNTAGRCGDSAASLPPSAFSLGVIKWKTERIPGSWAQTVGAELMQSDRPRSRPLMSPLVLTWKRQCSPKAECFLPHVLSYERRGHCTRRKQMEKTADQRKEHKDGKKNKK